jgi:hypothetical protein
MYSFLSGEFNFGLGFECAFVRDVDLDVGRLGLLGNKS